MKNASRAQSLLIRAPRIQLTANAIFVGGLLALLSVSAIHGLYESRHWLIFHDASWLLYSAWNSLQGIFPYRDFLEVNMPGTLILYRWCIEWFGQSDLAFRCFDASVLMLTVAGIIAFSWRMNRWTAVIGGLSFVGIHLKGGAVSMGQRDFLMTPFLAWSCVAWLSYCQRRQRHLLFLLGMALGFAAWIKPTVIILALLLLCRLLFLFRNSTERVNAVAALLAGALSVTSAMLLWLWHHDALAAFYEQFVHFSLGAHYQAIRTPLSFARLLVDKNIVAAAIVGIWIRYVTIDAERRAIISLGIVYGLLHFLSQAKGFDYHFYPLRLFSSLALAYILVGLPDKNYRAAFVAKTVVLGLCATSLPWLQDRSNDFTPESRGFSLEYTARVAADAGAALRLVPGAILRDYEAHYPGQPVQFFDITAGHFTNVAFRERWKLPSKAFVFYFYPEMSSEFLQEFGRQELAVLTEKRPPVLLISQHSWPFADGRIYEVFDASSPWHDFVRHYYQLTKQTQTYRVYARVK